MMKKNYYDFDENNSDIRESLIVIDDLKGQIDIKKNLQKEHWSAIQEKLRIDWTYDSNAIEGSSLTRGETLFF
ncbi:hypothetical protein MTBBW1_60038 [Desulfamplus magnetovallimortis]|uniref:Uncharacterized protein n=2 Tax=Desulfamplus magnetovallimortis TaxID=1246637 RepID=A0A1W1HID7_9BACT|nr:hypothetical protein MTBBW1_60038 [Desulfamplus magnetovallimortis]